MEAAPGISSAFATKASFWMPISLSSARSIRSSSSASAVPAGSSSFTPAGGVTDLAGASSSGGCSSRSGVSVTSGSAVATAVRASAAPAPAWVGGASPSRPARGRERPRGLEVSFLEVGEGSSLAMSGSFVGVRNGGIDPRDTSLASR